MSERIEDCIIIGAGLAGLAGARELSEAGLQVLVLDKGRRAGGRMASRHFEGAQFDYGAQFFSVRDPEFRRFVDGWLGTALAVPWFERDGSMRYCSPLGMNAIPQFLADSLRIECQVTVSSVRRDGKIWRVITDSGVVYSAESVILTAPMPQSLGLLSGEVEAAKALSVIEYHRCLAILAVLEGQSGIPEPGFLRVAVEPLQSLSDNRIKGLDADVTGVTILACPAYSLEQWESSKESVAETLLAAAAPWLASPVRHWRYHRWRYSQPIQTFPELFYAVDGAPPLVFAGDAFGGPRVEGAYLSGLAAARWLLSN